MNEAMAVRNEPTLSTPAAAPERKKRARGLWLLFDRISVYLPVMLMGLVAMGSYWLLRSMPEPELPPEERAVSHEADVIMKGFSVKTFDGIGRQESEVFGVEARHYPDTQEIEVSDAKVRSFAPTGQLTIASANLITANDAGTVFSLRGNGQVVRQAGKDEQGQRTPRMEFYGEYLKVTTRPESVFSDQPVLVIRDKDQMRGDWLAYRGDNNRRLVIKGNVKAEVQPAPRRR